MTITPEQLKASLAKDGIDVNRPDEIVVNPETNDIEMAPPPSSQEEQNSTGKYGMMSVENLYPNANKGFDANRFAATLRGAEKSFEPPAEIAGVKTGMGENFIERFEGTMLFPIIRGAEMAAKAFGNEDHSPDFTSLRQMIDDRIVYTHALEQAAPESFHGIQTALALESIPSLLKTGWKGLNSIKKVSPQVWEDAAKFVKKNSPFSGTKRVSKLREKILPDVYGPPADAIVNHPEEVLKLVKDEKISLDDIATEIGDELENIEGGLGKRVEKEAKNFVADPTKKINVVDPVTVTDPKTGQEITFAPPKQIIDDFRASTTTDDGKSILDSTQDRNLRELEEIISPKPRKVQKSGNVNKYENVVIESEEPVTHISPRNGMLALEKIDNIIDYEKVAKKKTESKYIYALLQARKAVKYQMRGDNMNWFKFDEDYADFKELSHGLRTKLQEADSAESFVDNIWGTNKNRVRERLKDALNYKDLLDTNVVGNGDAFFRRLAVMQGAKKVRDAKLQINRVKQEKVNNIINYWVGGTSAAFGTLAGVVSHGNPMVTLPAAAGGGWIGLKIGKNMANPERILNAAIKSKKLSAKAEKMAKDLIYIHQNYGSDGVISMMDIIGSNPAMNELTRISSEFTPKSKNGENVEMQEE